MIENIKMSQQFKFEIILNICRILELQKDKYTMNLR